MNGDILDPFKSSLLEGWDCDSVQYILDGLGVQGPQEITEPQWNQNSMLGS